VIEKFSALLRGRRGSFTMMQRRLIPLLLAIPACAGVSSDPTDHDLITSGAKRLFVTSVTYQGGGLGGLAGADLKCGERAHAGGLTGTYRAWLSDQGTSAASRLTHSAGGYSLVDGTLVAAGWGDLAQAHHIHAIDRDELGQPYSAQIKCGVGGGVLAAWTGSQADGSYVPAGAMSCTGWTELQHDGLIGNGVVGNTQSSDSHWTNSLCALSCTDTAALYCIEQ